MAKTFLVTVPGTTEAVEMKRSQVLKALNSQNDEKYASVPRSFDFFDFGVNEVGEYDFLIVRLQDEVTPEVIEYVNDCLKAVLEVEGNMAADVIDIRKYRKPQNRREMIVNIETLLADLVKNKDQDTRRKKVKLINDMLAALLHTEAVTDAVEVVEELPEVESSAVVPVELPLKSEVAETPEVV